MNNNNGSDSSRDLLAEASNKAVNNFSDGDNSGKSAVNPSEEN
jgi:hypothetical protein